MSSLCADMTFTATISAPESTPLLLTDVQLCVPVSQLVLKFMVGMGAPGRNYSDLQWRWTNTTASNKLWLGRADAGILVDLKGDGAAWDSPLFGVDFPVIPFVPPTWGGVEALPEGNPYGMNVTDGMFVAFSGPRTLSPGASVTFRFDLVLTPAKNVDMDKHWATRTVQVGYGMGYTTPDEVAAMGATVVTLHQGIGGFVNGSLVRGESGDFLLHFQHTFPPALQVNPYINYPFTDDVVPLLTNYTAQSNALGMATKYYYTIRELSNHAVELFAFRSLDGEVLNDGDPYETLPPDYSHAWNSHGGGSWLHQHVVTDYHDCWHTSLATGELGEQFFFVFTR